LLQSDDATEEVKENGTLLGQESFHLDTAYYAARIDHVEEPHRIKEQQFKRMTEEAAELLFQFEKPLQEIALHFSSVTREKTHEHRNISILAHFHGLRPLEVPSPIWSENIWEIGASSGVFIHAGVEGRLWEDGRLRFLALYGVGGQTGPPTVYYDTVWEETQETQLGSKEAEQAIQSLLKGLRDNLEKTLDRFTSEVEALRRAIQKQYEPSITVHFANGKDEVELAADWEESEGGMPKLPRNVMPSPYFMKAPKRPGTAPIKLRIENLRTVEAKNVEVSLYYPAECEMVYVSTLQVLSPSEQEKAVKREKDRVSISISGLLHKPAFITDNIYFIFPTSNATYEFRWTVNAGNMLDDQQGTLRVHILDKDLPPTKTFPI
jgi:hypothetical protein